MAPTLASELSIAPWLQWSFTQGTSVSLVGLSECWILVRQGIFGLLWSTLVYSGPAWSILISFGLDGSLPSIFKWVGAWLDQSLPEDLLPLTKDPFTRISWGKMRHILQVWCLALLTATWLAFSVCFSESQNTKKVVWQWCWCERVRLLLRVTMKISYKLSLFLFGW